jgi:hypothetical protein
MSLRSTLATKRRRRRPRRAAIGSVDDAFALLSEFVVNCEENVRVRAVRSLCAVTTRRPTLLARGVFAWLLRTDEPSAQVTAAMLEGLHELLRLQQLSYATPLEPLPAVDDARGSEEDDENGAAAAAAADVDGDADVDDKPLKASSSFVSMHDSSDTSFVATQMQLAMPKVLPHFNHASDEVRLQALKLGTMATRMGIVNPLVCVPSTLALLGDANADLSKPALALITFLHNKHANLLHSRLVDGVRFAYQQLRARLVAARPPRLTKREATLAGAVRAINTVTHEANFGRVFELLDSNRRQREAFVVGCATQLEANSQLGRVDAPYVAFLCELLASLHYRSVHEPIEVVYIAHRVVSLHGSGVVRLCEQQLAHADAATQARNVCDAAAALSLLIYLKRFLKRVWHLTADALRDHVPLSATAQRVKAVPVRRFEGELISSAGGFGDVILESGGDLARMRAQFETLQQLMENELDDQFDVKGEDDEAPPTSKQATPNGGATQRKRGRPPKGATAAAARKKRSRASKADDSEDDEGQEPLLSDD